MELKLKPLNKNLYPIKGLLIKGSSAQYWFDELKALKLDFSKLTILPIPDKLPNTIWGCLVTINNMEEVEDIRNHQPVQLVKNKIFIPTYADLHPYLSTEEFDFFFYEKTYIFHPDFGLVNLSTSFNYENLIAPPKQRLVKITEVEKAVFIPQKINCFYVKPLPQEEALKKMEEELNLTPKKFQDKALNIVEKGKMGLLKKILDRVNTSDISTSTNNEVNGNTTPTQEGFFSKTFKKVVGKMKEDYQDLEERNKNNLDKLLELMKNNPELALKYAIPLNDNPLTRGFNTNLNNKHVSFDFVKRWLDFSLFSNNNVFGNQAGGGAFDSTYYEKLQDQYRKTAEAFIKNKDYEKAAFIYMKLLKNYYLASDTLEKGGKYQEAALVYHKYLYNKTKAGECYEKGNMFLEAIDMYKELDHLEKVGDLYLKINKQELANSFFEKVIEKHRSESKYVKASFIYKNKIKNLEKAQELLKKGWEKAIDPFNCLNNYFANINDIKALEQEIEIIYKNHVIESNNQIFLDVLEHEYKKTSELHESVRKIAYEIISEKLPSNPNIASKLNSFNKEDPTILQDILRYKLGRRRK